MRHEILNERDKEIIYQDVLEFLRSDTNKKKKFKNTHFLYGKRTR